MARSASETQVSKDSEYGSEWNRVPSWHSFGYQPSYAFNHIPRIIPWKAPGMMSYLFVGKQGMMAANTDKLPLAPPSRLTLRGIFGGHGL